MRTIKIVFFFFLYCSSNICYLFLFFLFHVSQTTAARRRRYNRAFVFNRKTSSTQTKTCSDRISVIVYSFQSTCTKRTSGFTSDSSQQTRLSSKKKFIDNHTVSDNPPIGFTFVNYLCDWISICWLDDGYLSSKKHILPFPPSLTGSPSTGMYSPTYPNYSSSFPFCST